MRSANSRIQAHVDQDPRLYFVDLAKVMIGRDYKPRSRAYRAVYRHHRLHHFKNENYWLTVTTANTADRLFGTAPDPATVPTSPTAKNLHALR